MSKILSVAWIAFACCALCLRAENAPIEWHVYSDVRNGLTGNQQLTNAFIQAKSGDTITIHAGTYNLATEEMIFRYEKDENRTFHETAGICLYSTEGNLTIQGDPSVSRDEIVLSGMGSKESGEGLHSIMRLTGANCVVKHLTFYKGMCNYNNYVWRNGKQVNTDKWVFRRGGGLMLGANGQCIDCVFDGCYAGQGACIYGGAVAKGCDFLSSGAIAGNSGSAVHSMGSIYDSYFYNNSRGAVCNSSVILSNCVFEANYHKDNGKGLLINHTGSVIDCAFSNNTTVCIYLSNSAKMPNKISGCTFAYNTDALYSSSAGIDGTVACTIPISDSTFVGNNQINGFDAEISNCDFVRENKSAVSVLADCQKVYDCRFYGMIPTSGPGHGTLLEATKSTYVSVITNCSLYRCHIRSFNIRYGNVLTDVNRMENCLVEDTVVWGRSSNEGGYDASGTFRFTSGADVEIVNCTFTTNQSNDAYINTGGGKVTFKNTLFFNNLTGGVRTWGYCDFDQEDVETVQMENSVYKCSANLGDSSANWYRLSLTPMFMKDRYPNKILEHPYALCHLSPCIGFGTNDGLSENDIDLAGNKRLNGIVDVGCYENWHVSPGLKVVVR